MSMRRATRASSAGWPRVMTIAVTNARKMITQARGRCNNLPGARNSTIRLNRTPAILKQWARQEGLIVAKHL